jgi:glycosyltransferase involved in cell wall biosynthesis
VSRPLSVIVPTRDRPQMLTECLAALRATLRPEDELIVVDSASVDRDAIARVARDAGAHLVRCDLAGTSRARNAGVASAQHDVVAFVDDDVRVAPGWAPGVAAAFAESDVAFVTGRVDVPPAQMGFQRPVAITGGGDHPVTLDASSTDELGASANLAIRRSVIMQLGGFDEYLGGGAPLEAAEDLDLFDRLFAAGFLGRYEPAALAWHVQWRERWALVRLDWRYGLGSGARLSKLARLDRDRARFVLREVSIQGDIYRLARAVRRLEKLSILATLAKLAGTIVGFVRASLLRVRGGVFVARRRRS